jgi:hypothetical protein
VASELYRRLKPYLGHEVMLQRPFHTDFGMLPAGSRLRVNYVTGRHLAASLAEPCKCCNLRPRIRVRLHQVEAYFDL